MMNQKDKVYLLARAFILPLATLLPFLFTKAHEAPCSSFNMTDFSALYRATNEASGECLGIVGPTSTVTLAVAVGLLAVVVVSMLRVQPKGRETMRRFIAKQFIVSVTAAAITALAYVLMRNYSQGENFELVDFNPDGSIAYQKTILFGLGISVQSFLLILTVYLVIPVMRWYKVIFSRKYVGGQKKQELFQ